MKYYAVITKEKECVMDAEQYKEFIKNNKKFRAVKCKSREEAEEKLKEIKSYPSIKKTIDSHNYLCFYDSEFNAYDYNNGKAQEVVSIGLVIQDNNGKIVDTYYSTIKTKDNPKLTKRCKKITGLTQEEINRSKPFPQVCTEISVILKKYNLRAMYALGKEDQKQFIETKNLYTKNKTMNRLSTYILNIRPVLKMLSTNEAGDMSLSYLKVLCGLEENISHNALDDAIDLANVYFKMKTSGYSKEKLEEILKKRKDENFYRKSRRINDEKIYVTREILNAKNILVNYLIEHNNNLNNILLKAMIDDLNELVVERS